MIYINYTSHSNPERYLHIKNCFLKPDKILEYFPDEVIDKPLTGKRDAANKFRMFAKKGTELGNIFADFDKLDFRLHMTDITGVDCSKGRLRVELCQDGPGFYLEPHIDIPEKIITLQVYLGEGNQDWGTKLYNSEKVIYSSVPFEHNTGWCMSCDSPLIHGVEKNKVDGVRKSVIINYVTDNWRDKEQLY